MTCPKCAHCRGSNPRARKLKAKRVQRTLSVSAKAYAQFEAGAKKLGWSVARLVEEATRDV